MHQYCIDKVYCMSQPVSCLYNDGKMAVVDLRQIVLLADFGQIQTSPSSRATGQLQGNLTRPVLLSLDILEVRQRCTVPIWTLKPHWRRDQINAETNEDPDKILPKPERTSGFQDQYW